MAHILKRSKLLKDIDDDELHHAVTSQEVIGIQLEDLNGGDIKKYMKSSGDDILIRRISDKLPEGEMQACYASPLVSIEHARISFTGYNRVDIRDCNSHNGTYVASGGHGYNLQGGKQVKLVHGDTIYLGMPLTYNSKIHIPAVELAVKFISKPISIPPVIQPSPGRYSAPIDFDSDSDETESFDLPPASSLTSEREVWASSQSSMRDRTPKMSQISRRTPPTVPWQRSPRSQLVHVPYAAEEPDGSLLAFSRRNKVSSSKHQFVVMMDQMEDIRDSLSKLARCDGMRIEDPATSAISKKLEGLEGFISGFQAQQERIARDQQEQLELIRSLQLQLSLTGPDAKNNSVKRKLDDGEASSSLVQDDVPLSTTTKSTRAARRRTLPMIKGTVSTVSTMAAGAAIMWWGLASC